MIDPRFDVSSPFLTGCDFDQAQPDSPQKQWSTHYVHCLHCKTTDRPHHGHGFCSKCYSIWRSTPKRKAYERRWRETHKRKVKANMRAWCAKNRPTKFPVGLTVWVKYAGFWCEGEIIERPYRRVVVRLKGGTVLNIGTSLVKTKCPKI